MIIVLPSGKSPLKVSKIQTESTICPGKHPFISPIFPHFYSHCTRTACSAPRISYTFMYRIYHTMCVCVCIYVWQVVGRCYAFSKDIQGYTASTLCTRSWSLQRASRIYNSHTNSSCLTLGSTWNEESSTREVEFVWQQYSIAIIW